MTRPADACRQRRGACENGDCSRAESILDQLAFLYCQARMVEGDSVRNHGRQSRVDPALAASKLLQERRALRADACLPRRVTWVGLLQKPATLLRKHLGDEARAALGLGFGSTEHHHRLPVFQPFDA